MARSVPPGGASGASGSSRASSGDLASSWVTTPERLRRSAWVRAAYGSGSPATGTQPPAKATASVCARNSRTSRVLPTPSSPDTTTADG